MSEGPLSRALAVISDGGQGVDRRDVWCRWRFHQFMSIEPTGDEFDELCKLTGWSRSKVSGFLSAYADVYDKVCVKCGYTDTGLQRLLENLRKIRRVQRS